MRLYRYLIEGTTDGYLYYLFVSECIQEHAAIYLASELAKGTHFLQRKYEARVGGRFRALRVIDTHKPEDSPDRLVLAPVVHRS